MPTVLVVEDEFLIATDLQMSLQDLGWTVLDPAPSVRSALEILEDESPRVAVLDMQLGPELSTPVAVRLRELEIPFVVSSAFPDLPAVGGAAFTDVVNVCKPCVADELHSALLHAMAAD